MAKLNEFRTPNQETKELAAVVRKTEALWRRHHLSYDQTRAVSKAVRARLEIARPKRRSSIVERLTKEEGEKFVAAAYRTPGARGLMLKTLLQSGARVAEFVALKVSDFLAEETTLLVRKGKGDKSRGIPILPALAHELRTHLGGRKSGALFETRSSTAFTPRRVQQIVKEVAEAAGIEKRVHPHLLRHTIAQQLLEGGMTLEEVQRFLGHERLETTEIYAQSTPALIANGYRRAMGRQ